MGRYVPWQVERKVDFCPHCPLGLRCVCRSRLAYTSCSPEGNRGREQIIRTCVGVWWEWWGRLALARGGGKKRGVEGVGELERPHERECITLDVNMECSASRQEKQQQPPRDGVMEKTGATEAGEQPVWFGWEGACMEDVGSGKCGRGVRQERTLNGRYCLNCFLWATVRSHSFLRKKKKKRKPESETETETVSGCTR